MPQPVYPLEQVIKVKQRRVEEQEKVVRLKEQQLEKEKEKLKQKEADRDKAKKHHQDKLKQLREELDQGTTSDKVQQMKAYLSVTKEKLETEEKKVADQKLQVEQAEKALKAEIDLLKLKRQEVDKLESHKKDWMKEALKELEILEGREQDELGSITYNVHQRKRKRLIGE